MEERKRGLFLHHASSVLKINFENVDNASDRGSKMGGGSDPVQTKKGKVRHSFPMVAHSKSLDKT